MTMKEFLGYAMGTAFVLAVLGAAIGAVVLLMSVVPLMILLFPLTVAVLGAFVLVGYIRHRRARRLPLRHSARRLRSFIEPDVGTLRGSPWTRGGVAGARRSDTRRPAIKTVKRRGTPFPSSALTPVATRTSTHRCSSS